MQLRVEMDPQVDVVLETQATRQLCASSLCRDCLKFDLRGYMHRLVDRLEKPPDLINTYKCRPGFQFNRAVIVARTGSRYRVKPANDYQLCLMLFHSRITLRLSSQND